MSSEEASKSTNEIYHEVGRQGDILLKALLDGQSELRGSMASQESRTGDVEVDMARLSSAITNLLEGFAKLNHRFESLLEMQTTALTRVSQIEGYPRLTAAEVLHVQADIKQSTDLASAVRAARTQSFFDLRVGLLLALVGLICTVVATFAALYFSGAIRPHP